MFILKVTKAFDKAKLKYAIVGGHAVALHGAVRGTVDVDFMIPLTEKDFTKAEQALNSLGLQSRIPVSPADMARFRQEYIKNKNLIAWSYANPKNPTEVVDLLITVDLSTIKTITKSVHGQKLKIISIDDLISLKSKSGRPQDIEDVKALRKLK